MPNNRISLSVLHRSLLCIALLFSGNTSLQAQGTVESDGGILGWLFGSSQVESSEETDADAEDEDEDDDEMFEESDSLFSSDSDTDASSGDEKAPPRSDELIEITDSYSEAISLAQLHQRPLLVVFGADWCTWCRKLEKELTLPEAESVLKQWVIAKVDVDANPEVAQQLGASALPSLRILATNKAVVAGREGYLPLDELKGWLDENISQADPAIQKILYDSGNVSSDELPKLVEFLANRSPDLRQAAAQRMLKAKSDCADAVVDVLRVGKLSQRLAAIEILTSWQAPVSAIDPWQPESMSEQSFAPVIDWLRAQTSDEDDSDSESAADARALDPETISQAVTSLLTAPNESVSATMSQAVRYGDQLLPELRSRLANAELDDSQRILLRELMYRVLAGERLRLEHSSQFSAMASLDGKQHRAAVERILTKATSRDTPLIDELSQDSDPLVRELAIPTLQKIGALQENERLERLLADKSPSVRTAVLRQLSLNPKSKSTKSLIDYVTKESDEDLLVYAAKSLGSLGKKDGVEESLLSLLKSESWRVRAAALDAIGEMLSKVSSYDNDRSVSDNVAIAILKLTSDPDSFVAQRATTLLPKTVTEKTAKETALYLVSNPDQLKIFNEESSNYRSAGNLQALTSVAQEWLSSDDVSQVRGATQILSGLSPTMLQDELPRLLSSDDAGIREAALTATVASLELYRDNAIDNLEVDPGTVVALEPWFSVPEELLPKKKRARSSSNESAASESAESDEDIEAAIAEAGLNELDGLFGDNPFGEEEPTPASDDSQTESASAANETKDSSLAAFDLLDGFFGATPEVAIPDETPSQDDLEHMENEDELLESEDDELVASLPSEWLAKWHSEPTTESWIKDSLTALRTLPASKEHSTSKAAQWQNLAALAAGDASFTAPVISDLLQTPEPESKSSSPTKAAVLPWLPAADRLQVLQSTAIDWNNLEDSRVGELLRAATWIDDLVIADWFIESIEKSGSIREDRVLMVQRIILRGLIGHRADEMSPYLYPASRGYSRDDDFVPKADRAWQWLHQRFDQAKSPELKAAFLTAACYIDYESAVSSATGFVAQAESYDKCVQLAAIIALCHESSAAIPKARVWLQHSLPEVRELAVRRLLSAPTSFSEGYLSKGVRIIYDYEERMPAFWTDTEPLPVGAIKQALSSATSLEAKRDFSLLLLAAGEDVSQDDLLLEGDINRLLVAAALAKNKRLDDSSVAFYKQLAEEVAEEKGTLLLEFLKPLKDPRLVAIRKDLRKRLDSAD